MGQNRCMLQPPQAASGVIAHAGQVGVTELPLGALSFSSSRLHQRRPRLPASRAASISEGARADVVGLKHRRRLRE